MPQRLKAVLSLHQVVNKKNNDTPYKNISKWEWCMWDMKVYFVNTLEAYIHFSFPYPYIGNLILIINGRERKN